VDFSVCTLHIYRSKWVKIGISDSYTVPFMRCDFSENGAGKPYFAYWRQFRHFYARIMKHCNILKAKRPWY
jgi:hypothetical protein